MRKTESTNLGSELGKARHGSEIRADLSSKNAFCAFSGRGPPFHKKYFRVSLFKGPEIKLKFLTCVQKNFVRPKNCLICVTVEGGGGLSNAF